MLRDLALIIIRLHYETRRVIHAQQRHIESTALDRVAAWSQRRIGYFYKGQKAEVLDGDIFAGQTIRIVDFLERAEVRVPVVEHRAHLMYDEADR